MSLQFFYGTYENDGEEEGRGGAQVLAGICIITILSLTWPKVNRQPLRMHTVKFLHLDPNLFGSPKKGIFIKKILT